MNYTDITILLDRSGSMESIRGAMESAFNEFILQHKAVPSTRLTMMQFDSHEPIPEVVYEAQPINDAKPFRINPRELTPLWDALCRAVDMTGKRFEAMPEADRPDQVVFVIITDGLENASRKFKRQDVHERITHQQSLYNWQFVYLGANQDAIAVADSIGVTSDNAIDYAAAPQAVGSTISSLTANTVAYAQRQRTSAGAFSRAQRVGAMGGEKKPKTSKP